MSKQKYVIVSAPSASVLEMMVEAYVDQGMLPAGGLVIDNTDNGKVYMQALWYKNNEALEEDWTQGMKRESF